MKILRELISQYQNSPEIYHAGRYWELYEQRIIDEIARADLSQMRSGKYPIFGVLGFSENIYHANTSSPFYKRWVKEIVRRFVANTAAMPYSLTLADIRDMAYRHCILQGELSGLKSISEIEVSDYGKPQDLFIINGKKYTMQFLSYYLRACFVNKHVPFRGDETIVELGSGTGMQSEVIKKLFPKVTIINFDLPHCLYVCLKYLSASFDTHLQPGEIIPGAINLFGNWQFPMVRDIKYDLFWNAMSMGEMEPDIVKNYLDFVESKHIYLMQATQGKESTKRTGVVRPIKFADYLEMAPGYELIVSEESYAANRRMKQSGGYFDAILKNKQPI